MANAKQELEEFNIRLVIEVGKRPILYSRAWYDGTFHDAEIAWSEVASVVGLTTVSCKARWRNLRTVFLRRLKRNQKNSYYLTDAFQFLIPHIRGSSDNDTEETSIDLEESTVKIESNLSEDGDAIQERDEEPKKTRKKSLRNREKYVTELLEEASTSEEKNDTDENTPAKKKIARKESNSVVDLNDNSRSKCIQMFLLSLRPELEEMSDVQLKVFKRKVFTLMDDIMDDFD